MLLGHWGTPRGKALTYHTEILKSQGTFFYKFMRYLAYHLRSKMSVWFNLCNLRFTQDPKRLFGRKFKNTDDCLHQPIVLRLRWESEYTELRHKGQKHSEPGDSQLQAWARPGGRAGAANQGPSQSPRKPAAFRDPHNFSRWPEQETSTWRGRDQQTASPECPL